MYCTQHFLISLIWSISHDGGFGPSENINFQFFSLYLTMLLQTNLTANLIENQNIVSSFSHTANIEQRTPQNCPWLFIVCLLVSVLNDLKIVDPQSDALRRGAYRNFNPIQPILSYVAFEHLSQYIQSI